MSYHPIRSYFESSDEYFTRTTRPLQTETLPTFTRSHSYNGISEPYKIPGRTRPFPDSVLRRMWWEGKVSLLFQ